MTIQMAAISSGSQGQVETTSAKKKKKSNCKNSDFFHFLFHHLLLLSDLYQQRILLWNRRANKHRPGSLGKVGALENEVQL